MAGTETWGPLIYLQLILRQLDLYALVPAGRVHQVGVLTDDWLAITMVDILSISVTCCAKVTTTN